MLKLTIITPIYNNVYYTSQLIKEISSHTQSKYKLILIDNGSSDDTIELLKSYSDDVNVTVIKNNENMGFSYANNQGIQRAESEYICFLNNDVIARSDFLTHFRIGIKKFGKNNKLC